MQTALAPLTTAPWSMMSWLTMLIADTQGTWPGIGMTTPIP